MLFSTLPRHKPRGMCHEVFLALENLVGRELKQLSVLTINSGRGARCVGILVFSTFLSGQCCTPHSPSPSANMPHPHDSTSVVHPTQTYPPDCCLRVPSRCSCLPLQTLKQANQDECKRQPPSAPPHASQGLVPEGDRIDDPHGPDAQRNRCLSHSILLCFCCFAGAIEARRKQGSYGVHQSTARGKQKLALELIDDG